jgi:hypothetical protein
MPVLPGSQLGPYEILGLIGSGGMGEVYIGTIESRSPAEDDDRP